MTISRLPIVMVLTIAAAGGLAGCDNKAADAPQAQSPQSQARAVSVVTIEARDIQGGLAASGALVPREDTAIFPQINGYRVAEVLVDEGMTVKAGQPLARLDDTLLRAQLAQQTAIAVQQSVAADRADAEAARVKGLDAKGILSQEQIDTRRYAAQSARAQAAAQAAAVNDVKTREGLMTIRAPYAGLVIERNVRPGDLSGGTNPWFRIAKNSQVELAADVGEDALDKIKVGAPVLVTLADGAKVQGSVRLVSPRVDAGTKLGRVKISLPVRSDIRAGGFASASFTGSTRSALAVPEPAIRYDADGAAVMVVGPGDKVIRAPVTTGQRGGGYVELITGPPVGSRVVQKAATMLVPGDVIRPANPS